MATEQRDRTGAAIAQRRVVDEAAALDDQIASAGLEDGATATADAAHAVHTIVDKHAVGDVQLRTGTDRTTATDARDTTREQHALNRHRRTIGAGAQTAAFATLAASQSEIAHHQQRILIGIEKTRRALPIDAESGTE